MRQIDHVIAGGAGAAPVRFGDVFDPNNGGIQARVALGDAVEAFYAHLDGITLDSLVCGNGALETMLGSLSCRTAIPA